jgi:hypothetical protein
MDSKGWSQSDTARAASKFLPAGETFRRDSISTYIRGVIPHGKNKAALAKAFGLEPDELVSPPLKRGMPCSLLPVDGDPKATRLIVDAEVSNETALAVAKLVNSDRHAHKK